MMKKTISAIAVVLTVLMLVSTATALPVATSQPIVKVVRKMDKINQMVSDYDLYAIRDEVADCLANLTDFEKYTQDLNFTLTEKLRQKSIEILGIEKYEDVRSMLENRFSLIEEKLNRSSLFGPGTSFDMWYQFLLELTIFIFSIAFLLCGHSLVGDLLGLTIFLIFIPIPVFCVEFIEACLVIPLVLTSILLGSEIDLEQLLYDFGVLGIIAGLCVILPLSILVGIIAVPILSVLFTLQVLGVLLVEGLTY